MPMKLRQKNLVPSEGFGLRSQTKHGKHDSPAPWEPWEPGAPSELPSDPEGPSVGVLSAQSQTARPSGNPHTSPLPVCPLPFLCPRILVGPPHALLCSPGPLATPHGKSPFTPCHSLPGRPSVIIVSLLNHRECPQRILSVFNTLPFPSIQM